MAIPPTCSCSRTPPGGPRLGPRTSTTLIVAAALPGVRAETSRRTFGPRWDRKPDRRMEYLAALALSGGRTTSNAIARSLARTLPELSSLREDLIREGDICSPQRAYVALTMLIFSSFILARYDEARAVSETELLSLDKRQLNCDAN